MISLLFHHFFHSFVTMKPNLTKLNMTEWDKMQEHQIYNDCSVLNKLTQFI